MKRLLHNLTTLYTEVSPSDGGRTWVVETGTLPSRLWNDALRFGWRVAAYNLWFRLFK